MTPHDAQAREGTHSKVVQFATDQAALQPWIEMECYQLGCGDTLARIDHLDLGSPQLVRETQTAAVQKLGITPANLCTVSVCTPDPTFRFSELAASATDAVFFMPGNTEFDIYVPAGACTSYISLDQEELLHSARTIAPIAWELAPAQLISISAASRPAFSHLINQVFEQVRRLTGNGEPVDASVLHTAIMQGIEMIIATGSDAMLAEPERARALHVCRKARAFIDEQLAMDTVPTIADTCRATEVSERTLQYAFRRYVNMTPLIYLRMCRLNRVRATLRHLDSNSTTVTTVALRYGFIHLGRFSADYKNAFGELPSETLCR
jgi:AraC family ethanolamine operon transcriptional activator